MKRKVYKLVFSDGGFTHGIFDTAAKAAVSGRLYCRQWQTSYSFAHAELLETVESGGRTDREILNNYKGT